MYIVHLNYGHDEYNFSIDLGPYSSKRHTYYHLVRCPDGSGRIFKEIKELNDFIVGKNWRYAK